jgi:hypothetical protein
MTDENQKANATNRRDVLKKIGATGVVATGAAGLGGTAAAEKTLDWSGSKSLSDYGVAAEDHVSIPKNSDVTGVESVDIVITEASGERNSGRGKMSGTVTATVQTEERKVTRKQDFSDVTYTVSCVECTSSNVLAMGAGQGAVCEILSLSLGPLDLDLLGLQVHLDEVNLQVDAQPGSGNLLGNLLCAVAGLLD